MKGLTQKKLQLEKQLGEIANKRAELEEELANVCQAIEKIKANEQKGLAEKTMKAKKEWELAIILSSEKFYKFIQSRVPKTDITDIQGIIWSYEFEYFLLKNSYANRIIRSFKNDEVELSPGIVEAMINKLLKISLEDRHHKTSKKVLFVNKLRNTGSKN